MGRKSPGINVLIRHFEEEDWPGVWGVLEPVFRAGETYPQPPDITEQEARTTWLEVPSATYVAHQPEGGIVGTYYIKPNQPGLGSHVCNCGYAVAPSARNRGVGGAMCIHSQEQARALGFRAMQFNLVVSTNAPSIHLWKKHGFEVVGRLPGTFRHARLGFVDAFVMFKEIA